MGTRRSDFGGTSPASSSTSSSSGFGGVAVQEVGDDVILNCSSDREVHLCRWKTPYLNTYIVGEGIYVERGRIAWVGRRRVNVCRGCCLFFSLRVKVDPKIFSRLILQA